MTFQTILIHLQTNNYFPAIKNMHIVVVQYDVKICRWAERSKAEEHTSYIMFPASVSIHGTQFPSSLANQDKF